MRSGSPRTRPGSESSISSSSSRPFASASARWLRWLACSASRRSKSDTSSVSLPASIFDRSRMSDRRPARFWALSWICSRYCWRRGGAMPGCNAMRASPISAFSGVRIAWLVWARNALLARLAASAASRASVSARSVSRRSVTSSAIQMVPSSPASLRSTICASTRHQNRLPSRRRSCWSIVTGLPLSSSGPASRPISSYAASLGQTTEPGCPTNVPDGQPSIRSKLGLTRTKRRSRVSAMPIEARCRMVSCSSRARSTSVTSRALITRYWRPSISKRPADISIDTGRPNLVTNTAGKSRTLPFARIASASRSRSEADCQSPSSAALRPSASATV